MAQEQHWTAETNRNYAGDELSGWIIRYDPTPVGKKNPDGTTSYSMNFPALALTAWVADPEKVAVKIAAMLNAHDALLAVATAYDAWEADVILNADWSASTPRLTQTQWDRLIEIQSMRNAAIAKAEGRSDAVRVEN